MMNMNMPAIVSLLVLGSALWILLSRKYPPRTEKWAYSAVSFVLGYWIGGSGP